MSLTVTFKGKEILSHQGHSEQSGTWTRVPVLQRQTHIHSVSPSAPGKQIYLIAARAVSELSKIQVGSHKVSCSMWTNSFCVRGQTQQRHKHCLDSLPRLRTNKWLKDTVYGSITAVLTQQKSGVCLFVWTSVCLCVCVYLSYFFTVVCLSVVW